MRIDIVLIILLVALVGLGFLVSDDLRHHQDMASLQADLARLQSEQSTCQGQNQTLTGQVDTLTREKGDLSERVDTLVRDNQACQARVQVLEEQMPPVSQPASVQAGGDDRSFSGNTGAVSLLPLAWLAPFFLVPGTGLVLWGMYRRTQSSKRSPALPGTYVLLTDQEREAIIQHRIRQ